MNTIALSLPVEWPSPLGDMFVAQEAVGNAGGGVVWLSVLVIQACCCPIVLFGSVLICFAPPGIRNRSRECNMICRGRP